MGRTDDAYDRERRRAERAAFAAMSPAYRAWFYVSRAVLFALFAGAVGLVFSPWLWP
jgi:hypothetical protein